MKDHITPIVQELSNKFGFNLKEALIFLGSIDIKCLLPFTGEIRDGCRAINWSYGLHTQCQNQIIDNRKYCFKCKLKKEGNKFIGDIEERLKCKLLEYVDNKGRRTIPWINYIKERGFDLELCLRFARNARIDIPAEHLEKRIRSRGRPKKKKEKKEIVNNTFNILGTDFSEEILELYKIVGTNLGKDSDGVVYNLYNFGAVKHIN